MKSEIPGHNLLRPSPLKRFEYLQTQMFPGRLLIDSATARAAPKAKTLALCFWAAFSRGLFEHLIISELAHHRLGRFAGT
jgi:hypothetical protein